MLYLQHIVLLKSDNLLALKVYYHSGSIFLGLVN